MILPGFSPKAPSLPPAPPPPPLRADPVKEIQEDPQVAEAKKKQRLADKQRRGRRATILTSGQGVLETTPLSQPRARSAQVLG